jgi:glycosyltransferase involved in cell wall biosynthesis
MLKSYAEREAEIRKIFLINKFISKCDRIVDLGCGNGEYIPYLRMKASCVIGVDIDINLAKISKANGCDVILATLDYLPFKDESFDYVWASEVVEHFPTLDVLDKIERITSGKIILTMPNPIFPHFKRDSTHILQYSIASLSHFLNNKSKESKWIYSIRGLGFKEMVPTKLIRHLTLYVAWQLPWLSPTVAVIGIKNSTKQDMDKRIIKVIAYSILESGTLAGGYRIAIELIRRWSFNTNYIFHIYTTEEGEKMIGKYIPNNPNIIYDIIWSPSFITKVGLKFTYISISVYIFLFLMGSIKASVSNNKKSTILIYSTTPFLPDLIPGLLMKLKLQGSSWFVAHAMFSPNPLRGGFSGSKKPKIPNLRDIGFYMNEKLTYPLFKKHADFISETNELDRERCIREGISSEKVFVIKGGVDINLPQIVPEPKEKEYDAVFIGRLHPQKGPLELIDIWKYVCKRKNNAKLAIIGNGPLEHDVKKKIIFENLENNIDMLGFQDGIEKIKIFKNSKIVLHPALYDSGGMAACEAMICGLPGISFDLDSLKIYYPKGMLKTPCYDFEIFSENIIKLINDIQLYEKTRKDAIEWAKEWDWNKVANEVLEKLKM